MLVETKGEPALVFDLGTGLKRLAARISKAAELARSGRAQVRANVLLSHLHWDHVLGLPFSVPVSLVGAEIDVYGPTQGELTIQDAFGRFMQPPFFPVGISDLQAEVKFHEVWEEDLAIGGLKVRIRPVPHIGPTIGFRIEREGVSVAYVTDHQQPLSGQGVDEGVLELCDGVDLLIHDAQYSTEELAARPNWGHSSVDYAVHVARCAGVSQLALFHHDPSHEDVEIDRLLEHARSLPDASGVGSIIAAAEGACLELGGNS